MGKPFDEAELTEAEELEVEDAIDEEEDALFEEDEFEVVEVESLLAPSDADLENELAKKDARIAELEARLDAALNSSLIAQNPSDLLKRAESDSVPLSSFDEAAQEEYRNVVKTLPSYGDDYIVLADPEREGGVQGFSVTHERNRASRFAKGYKVVAEFA